MLCSACSELLQYLAIKIMGERPICLFKLNEVQDILSCNHSTLFHGGEVLQLGDIRKLNRQRRDGSQVPKLVGQACSQGDTTGVNALPFCVKGLNNHKISYV